MAFIRVDPVQVHVRTDWFDGRPREVTWGDQRLPVTRLSVGPRRGRGLPGRHRPAHVLRGRDAARPPLPDASTTARGDGPSTASTRTAAA